MSALRLRPGTDTARDFALSIPRSRHRTAAATLPWFLGLAACGGGSEPTTTPPPVSGGGGSSPPPPVQPQSTPVNFVEPQTFIKAVDGPIAGATVFVDSNGNGEFDSGEPNSLSGENGNALLAASGGRLMLTGGVDTATTVPLGIAVLEAPEGSAVISPLTTLVGRIGNEADVKDKFGIPSDYDLLHTDFYYASSHNPGDYSVVRPVLNIAEETMVTLKSLASVYTGLGYSDPWEAALSTFAVVASQAPSIDLTDASFIKSLFDGIGGWAPSDDLLTAVGDAVAAINQLIAASDDPHDSTGLAASVVGQVYVEQWLEGLAVDGSAGAVSDFQDAFNADGLAALLVEAQARLPGASEFQVTIETDGSVAPSIPDPSFNHFDQFVFGGNDDGGIRGYADDDVLVGSPAQNLIRDPQGSDVLIGGDGNDMFSGGDGNDSLWGGSGDDYMAGDRGNDFLDGGTGVNWMVGGSGNDTFFVTRSAHTDKVFDDFAPGSWQVAHANGWHEGYVHDLDANIVTYLGNVIYDGEKWTQWVFHDPYGITGSPDTGINPLQGGGATYHFLSSADRLSENDGLDTLLFDQTIDPGDLDFQWDGNDLTVGLEPYGGDVDLVEWGLYDTAPIETFQFMTGLQVNAAQIGVWGGLGGAKGTGPTDSSDDLEGSAKADWLTGAKGNDTLHGLAGDDLLTGGLGSDVIDGGDGNDTVFYGENRSEYTVSFEGDTISVTDNGTFSDVDTLTNVEFLSFADATYLIDDDTLVPIGVI